MTTLTFPYDWTTGHVGGVAPVCEVLTWLATQSTKRQSCLIGFWRHNYREMLQVYHQAGLVWCS